MALTTSQAVIGTHGRLKAWASKRVLSLDGIKVGTRSGLGS